MGADIGTPPYAPMGRRGSLPTLLKSFQGFRLSDARPPPINSHVVASASRLSRDLLPSPRTVLAILIPRERVE
jgi:hypothetical protein